MTKSFLIKNGILATPEGLVRGELLVKDGIIAEIGQFSVDGEDIEVFDAKGAVVAPALADVHVHFREPGRPDKETIRTGSLAAARGGYTVVCPMPNLTPAPDSPENLELELDLIRKDAVIDVRPYATITKERKGLEPVDFKALADKVAGFSDDGSGVQDEDVMRKAMEAVKAEDKILAAHCEDNSLLKGGYIHDGRYAAAHGHKGICSESEWGPIKRDVELAAETGCAYHVCHISTKESVNIIREAKAKGINVSCETGPHYLTLCEDDLKEEGRFKMNPPLRSREDLIALIEGLKDGTIDMIATDHAPHTAEEKSKGLEASAMGVVGLETAFAVAYTGLVRKGIIGLDRLIHIMSTAPRDRFRLGGGRLVKGAEADIAVFNIKNPYTIDSEEFLSKGHSTPFEGWKVYGKCILTLYRGGIVWKNK